LDTDRPQGSHATLNRQPAAAYKKNLIKGALP
jgi:hypothetical protein